MNRIPVFYAPEMVANMDHFSPSASKPASLVERWLRESRPIEIRRPAPASIEDFCRVHDPDFVEDVFSLRILNGFHNREREVADSLPYTSGSMMAAAKEALANGMGAVSPSSGFHHASHASCHGYCTFNGLMVAAAAIKATQPDIHRIGILDFDQHEGDGTDDILRTLDIDWVTHYTVGGRYDRPSDAEPFLQLLPEIVQSFRECALLLYQAGADPHVDDPLGGWLTSEQLARRDALVFSTARALGIPVAWNLAGGYQRPVSKVLDIHCQTLDRLVGQAGSHVCGLLQLAEHAATSPVRVWWRRQRGRSW